MIIHISGHMAFNCVKKVFVKVVTLRYNAKLYNVKYRLMRFSKAFETEMIE